MIPTQAWKQFNKLHGVNNDPMAQTTVADLVVAAQFEIDLFEEGDSELTPRQILPIRRFVANWKEAA